MKTQLKPPAIPPDLLREVIRHNYASPTSCWTVLEGGRTNRVWRLDGPAGTLICKLFARTDDNPLYPNRPGSEYEVLASLSPHGIAPQPVALLNTAAGEALIYRHIPGKLWREDAGVHSVAGLLSRLHELKPNVLLRTLASGSEALLRQIDTIASNLQTPTRAVRKTFDVAFVSPVEHPSIIHTDVVANNIVITTKGIRLIDWQCPGLGDPCEDIASFLSPAMQFLYMGGPIADDQKAAFLCRYPNKEIIARYHKLAPLFHLRAAVYCCWQAERGNRDYRDAADLELLALQKLGGDHDKAGQYHSDTHITRRAD